jgi:hypothetical protein
MMRGLLFSTVLTLLMTLAVTAQVNSVTKREPRRTGANLTEATLTTANVNVTEFGKLCSYPVDGPVSVQPLYVTGVTINGVPHNVLYVATMNDKLYAFDADGSSPTPLWITQRTALVDAVTPAAQVTRKSNVFWDSPSDGPLAYAWSENDVLKAYRLNAGRMTTPAYMQGGVLSPDEPGASLTLSANGSTTGTGIVWASMPITQDGIQRAGAGILRAYDAETLTEIWTSEQNAMRDHAGRLPKFVSPVVANGRVYMPTLDGSVVVYGLLPVSAAPDVSVSATTGTKAISADGNTFTGVVGALAEPGVIGINFVGTSATPMGAAESAGIIAKPNWNNAIGAVRSTVLPLVDESAASTPAAVTWTSNNDWKTPIADQPGNARMMKGYLDTTSTSTTTVTVTGLAQRSYDVYVYADGDNGVYQRAAAYTINGADITTTTIHLTDAANTNFGATFTRADSSIGNYVKFSIAATGFTLSATPLPTAAGNRRAPINGIQIVPVVSVPPVPSAIGIKFAGTSTVTMAASESAGVVPKTHWNNAASAVRSTPLPLVDDAGTLTAASVTWTANNGWMTPIADQTGNARLMKGYLDTSTTSVTRVTVAGLPSRAYDVYVYADGDNRDATRTASYRITGSGITTPGVTATTMNLTDQANTNFSGTFTQSAGTSGNYVKFTIHGNGFTLTATPGTSTNVSRRAPVNAIQIVSSSLTPPVSLDPAVTVGGIGAGQGVEVRDGKVYLYGDATTGIIREYDVTGNDALGSTGRQVLLTVDGRDVVPHPTGFTTMSGVGTLLGNTVAEQGTIFMIDWARALASGTLDGAIQATVADDLAVNGTRPEFVRVGERWLVATADYGAVANEIRIYDPQRLETATRTSEPGVLVYRFRSSPFVQTLHWLDSPGLLVLVQNQRTGQGWRLTVVDLARSIAAGQQVVTQTIDLSPQDELEGFHLVAPGRGLFLTSSSLHNLYFANVRLF